MKERPIILKAHEVRGILEGRQTQLRRIVKLEKWMLKVGPDGQLPMSLVRAWVDGDNDQYMKVPRDDETSHRLFCPFGQVGDRLWGRETFFTGSKDGDIVYAANNIYDPLPEEIPDGWSRKKSSSQMLRVHSRILLEVVSVRVERLQDISEADARAEGFEPLEEHPASIVYAAQFDKDYGRESWNANPWMWLVSFRRVEA